MSEHLVTFVHSFSGCFKTKTDDGADYAKLYLQGLVTQAPRKNMERIDEHLDSRCYQNVQQFISDSPWDERPVYDAIALRANARLGGRADSCLIIDESAHTKKGTLSVGVARQYNGRLGKQDNCQVGVYSALNCGTHTAIIGTRLYLPDEWVQDKARCLKVGVPEAAITARSKIDHAAELIDQAVEQGVDFACIVFDAFYGRDSALRDRIHQAGLIYCAEVPANINVFTHRPEEQDRAKQTKADALSVSELAAQMIKNTRERVRVNLREGERGMVQAEVWAQRVWVWPAGGESREQWLLVRRLSDGEIKTCLCNAPATTTIKRMAQWQAARFQIERAFQDAKSHLGMSDYQSRGWRAWQHHMVLVAMALVFVTEERLLQQGGELELLSARDIIEMIDYCLIGPRTAQQVMDQLNTRHARRRRDATNAQRRQRKKLGLPKQQKSHRNT